MNRNSLLLGVMMAGAAGSALADDVVVGSSLVSPLMTSNPANGSPGNITFQNGTILSINTTGAAVTLNSNNSIINGGTIQNTFTGDGAIGLHVLGGNTGSYTQQSLGLVNITGSGLGNSAILVDGSSPFVGTIDLQLGSVVLSRGTNGEAIGIHAPVQGDVNVNSTVNAFDSGARGVVVTAPITGNLTVGGTVFVGTYAFSAQYSGSIVDPVTGSAVALGSSVTGGFLIEGPAGGGQGIITAGSDAPAVVIAPSVAGTAAGDITIGQRLTDPLSASFSVINRGTITNAVNDPGVSTTGLRIGESSSGPAAHTVTLPGGLFTFGTISVTAESDNLNARSVAAATSNAIALEIGAGAILRDGGSFSGQVQAGSSTNSIVLDSSASTVKGFYNGLTVTWNGQERLITNYDPDSKTVTVGAYRGSDATFTAAPGAGDSIQINSAALRNDGTISGKVNGTLSNTVTGILIQPYGNVPTFLNQGRITTESYAYLTTASNLTAYGVRDLSGSLTTIKNTGSIIALAGYNPTGISGAATQLDDNSQKTIAVDLTAGTQNQTILNFGTITGDVNFGSGTNLLLIEGASSGVSGVVRSAGSGTVDIFVSPQGSGGTFLTYGTTARNVSVGSSGQVVFLVTQSSKNQTLITATNNLSFADGSVISILPGNFLPSGDYTLAHANGNIHIDNPSNAAVFTVPYLFHADLRTDNLPTVAADGNDLKLTLTRKTAAELGLTGNRAEIYEAVVAAAAKDNSYGAALMSLTDATNVNAALDTALPDLAGGVRALAVSFTDQATGVIGSRQRALMTAPAETRTDLHFWAQEFYNNVQTDSSGTSSGYGGAGQGLSFGAEWGTLGSGRYGVGLTYFSSQETERHPRESKTNADWAMVSAYAAWRSNSFFLAPQLNAGYGDMKTRRTLLVGPLGAQGSLARLPTAAFKAELASGGVTSGYIFDFGEFQIIPTIAIDGLFLRTGEISEINSGGLGLVLKSQTQNSVRGFAGIIGKGSFAYDQGFVMPQLVAGFSREFLNEPATIDGYFESAPGSPFHLVGPTLDPNRLVGGLSLGYVLSNWSAGVSYDASANTGQISQSATFSISSRF